MKAVSKGSLSLSLLVLVVGCGGTALYEDLGAEETGGGGFGGSPSGGGIGAAGFGTGAWGTGLTSGGGWVSGGGTRPVGGRPPVGGVGPTGGWYTGGWYTGGWYTGGWVSGGGTPTGGWASGGVTPIGGTPPDGGRPTGGVPPIGGGPVGGTAPDGGAGGTGNTGNTGNTGSTGGTGGTPECTLVGQSIGYGYCDMQYECPNDWPYVWCDGYDDSAWCYCESMMSWGEYEVEGIAAENACGVIDDFCINGNQIEFTDPADCTSGWGEVGPSYCFTEQECTQRAQIAEGISVVSRYWKDASCEYYGDHWSCYCYDMMGIMGSMNFDLPPSLVSDNACNDAMRICEGGVIEPTGPRECSRAYQYASPDWCEAQLDCARPATIAGEEIQIHESLYTDCYTSAAGGWTCDCGAGVDHTSFTVSEDEDPWSACELASTRCAEVLSE